MHFLLPHKEAWKVGEIDLLLRKCHLVMLPMPKAFLWRYKVARDYIYIGIGMEHSILFLVFN